MWRSGNDSFGGKGKITERYLIDIDGFKMIIDDFFKTDPEVNEAFIGAFRRHHPYKNIAYLRMHTKSKSAWKDICMKLSVNYEYNKKLLNYLSYPFMPELLKVLFIFYRIQSKIYRYLLRTKVKHVSQSN